jgi:hypothetical protein
MRNCRAIMSMLFLPSLPTIKSKELLSSCRRRASDFFQQDAAGESLSVEPKERFLQLRWFLGGCPSGTALPQVSLPGLFQCVIRLLGLTRVRGGLAKNRGSFYSRDDRQDHICAVIVRWHSLPASILLTFKFFFSLTVRAIQKSSRAATRRYMAEAFFGLRPSSSK